MRIVPVAPIGWPIETPLPFGFVRSGGSPSSRMTAIACGNGALAGERRPEPGQVVFGHAVPDVLVGVERDGALAARNLDRSDLLGEVPASLAAAARR